MRRRLEHLLGLGTSVKGCPRDGDTIDDDEIDELMEYLAVMDDANKKRNLKRKKDTDTVQTLSIVSSPLKQTKLNVSVQKLKRREMDLSYARMVIMSTCRRSYTDSPFTSYFFDTFCKYTPPKHTAVFGSLLDAIYEDTRSKVMHRLNLTDPDSLITLTMDA